MAKFWPSLPRLSLICSLSLLHQNSELLTLTYGAIVTQLIKDYKEVKTVNVELEKMYVSTPDAHDASASFHGLQGVQHWRAVS